MPAGSRRLKRRAQEKKQNGTKGRDVRQGEGDARRAGGADLPDHGGGDRNAPCLAMPVRGVGGLCWETSDGIAIGQETTPSHMQAPGWFDRYLRLPVGRWRATTHSTPIQRKWSERSRQTNEL